MMLEQIKEETAAYISLSTIYTENVSVKIVPRPVGSIFGSPDLSQ